MVSYKTQKAVSDLFAAVAEGEYKLEQSRQILAEILVFEPFAAFKRIDRQCNDFLTVNDINNFFLSNNVNMNIDEVSAVFNLMDANKDGKILFEEFAEQILPQNNPTLKEICSQRQSYYVAPDEFLQYEVEMELTRLLQQYAQNLKWYNILKQELVANNNINVLNIFKLIDSNNKNYLDFYDIDLFVKQRSKLLSKDELSCFFNYFDQNFDNKIDFQEFYSALIPDQCCSNLSQQQQQQQQQLIYNKEQQFYPQQQQQQFIENLDKNQQIFYSQPKNRQMKLNDQQPLQMQSAIQQKSYAGIDPQQEILRGRSMTPQRQQQELNNDVGLMKNVSRNNNQQYSPGQQRLNLTYLNQKIQEVEDKTNYEVYIQKSRSISRERQKNALAQQQIIDNQPYTFSQQQQPTNTNTFSPQSQYKQQKNLGYKTPERMQKAVNYYNDQDTQNYVAQQKPQSPTFLQQQQKLTPSSYYQRQQQQQLSPLKETEEMLFAQIFKELIVLEREQETLKKSIALRSDFNLMNAFRIFDPQGSGNTSKLQFEKSLNNLGIYPTENELYLFFKKFDHDKDGYINYSEFCQIFYPPNKDYLSLINSRQPNYIELSEQQFINLFSMETVKLFTRLLNTVFQTEISIDLMKQKINQRPTFNLQEAFKSIDQNQNGEIVYEEFKMFLEKHNIWTTDNDMLNVFKRFDKNKNGKISFAEFVEEMTPKSAVLQFQ